MLHNAGLLQQQSVQTFRYSPSLLCNFNGVCHSLDRLLWAREGQWSTLCYRFYGAPSNAPQLGYSLSLSVCVQEPTTKPGAPSMCSAGSRRSRSSRPLSPSPSGDTPVWRSRLRSPKTTGGRHPLTCGINPNNNHFTHLPMNTSQKMKTEALESA